MTINDAEGVMTAQRYDGHLQWPSDYERHHEVMILYPILPYAPYWNLLAPEFSLLYLMPCALSLVPFTK